MRNPNRIPEIIDLINQLWGKYPDLRFFQFLEFLKSKFPNKSINFFYLEDDELKQLLVKLINEA